MVHPDLPSLTALAAQQHGLVSVAQAATMGIDHRALRRLVRSGTAERLHPKVIRFASAPTTKVQLVQAAVLQVPGSVASHESALLLHGIDRIPFAVAVTSPPRSANHHRGIRVHRFGDLADTHVVVCDGIRCTSLARTVVDVSAWFSPSRLAHVLDRVTITERQTSIAGISRVLREVHHHGRRDIACLARLLDSKRPDEPTPRSRLERRADRVLERSSLPPPRKEYPLPGDQLDGFVDRAWDEARLILEIDGRVWHSREQSMARDRARDRAAAAAGWLTMRVLDEELEGPTADLVVSDIEATYQRRLMARPAHS